MSRAETIRYDRSSGLMRNAYWFKVPVLGMPGFQTCEVMVDEHGRLFDNEGEMLPDAERTCMCGLDTTWLMGRFHLCAVHFPWFAEGLDDGAEALEQAWREHVS